MTIVPGLCSVTFRQLSVTQVVDVAAKAGLRAIEWGGDVHVPLGDIVAARDASARCANVGIDTASYGSYVFAGPASQEDLRKLVETTLAVRAPNARVWCPFGLLPGSIGEERNKVVRQLRYLARIASDSGTTISLEYHAGTLTQTAESAMSLIEDVGAENLFTYWQPVDDMPVPELLDELRAVLPRLSHLHVFRWDAHGTRLPLGAGADLWPDALQVVSSLTAESGWAADRAAMLEFVENDDPGSLERDARVLRGWLSELPHGQA